MAVLGNLSPVLVQCAACRSPFADEIGSRMKRGVPDTQIAKWLKDNGGYISRITLGNHKRDHLTDEFQTLKAAAMKQFKKNQKTLKTDGDLASVVRDHVLSMVNSGELLPTLAEGLRAQEMIDRRVEKSADRDLSVALAGILGGGPVINMIEMEAEEITEGSGS